MYIGRARVGELLRGNKEAIQRCRVENFFSPLFFFFFFSIAQGQVDRDTLELRAQRCANKGTKISFYGSRSQLPFSVLVRENHVLLYMCFFFIFHEIKQFLSENFSRKKYIYILKLLYLTSLLNIIEYNIKIRVTALQISLCLQILKSNEFFLPDIYFFHSMLEQ